MNYLSLCSGIEAATTAWHSLGWTPVAFAEIEPFPSAVLADHYPDVPNLGDMTQYLTWPVEMLARVDILVGGTPCQAFSVAGARESLGDERGNLTLTYAHIIDTIDRARALHGRPPALCLWENVPGVLNTDDNALGCFLGLLAGEDDALTPPGGRWSDAGYVRGPARAIAWRCLDAQYFGLAQRRDRVFLIASAGDIRPEEILFESQGLRRDTPPSRGQGERTSPTLAARTRGGGGLGTDFECDGGLIPELTHTLRGEGFDASEDGTGRGIPLVPAARDGGIQGLRDSGEEPKRGFRMVAFGEYSDDETASVMKSRDYKDATDLVVEAPYDTFAIQAGALKENPNHGPDGVGVRTDGCAYTIEARAEVQAVAFVQNTRDEVRLMNGDGSIIGALPAEPGAKQQCYIGIQQGQVEEGTLFRSLGFNARQDPNVWDERTGPIDTDGSTQAVFSFRACGQDGFTPSEDITPPIIASDGGSSGMPTVAFNLRGREGGAMPEVDDSELAVQRSASGGSSRTYVAQPMAVRRLTPRECECLQGFPDDYTLITYRNKPSADGPRYKALGNSMAVPVMRWLGKRIAMHVTSKR